MSVDKELEGAIDRLSTTVDVLAELAVVNARDFPEAAEVVGSAANWVLSVIGVLSSSLIQDAIRDAQCLRDAGLELCSCGCCARLCCPACGEELIGPAQSEEADDDAFTITAKGRELLEKKNG